MVSKLNIASAALLVMLVSAGCNKDAASTSPADQSIAGSSDAEAGPETTGVDNNAGVLASGEPGELAKKLVSGSKGVAIYDRNVDPKTGKQERQLFLEFIGPRAEDMEAAVKAAVSGTAYVPGPFSADEKGVRMTLVSKSGSPIRILARNAGVGPKLKTAGATASIYMRQDPTEAAVKPRNTNEATSVEANQAAVPAQASQQ